MCANQAQTPRRRERESKFWVLGRCAAFIQFSIEGVFFVAFDGQILSSLAYPRVSPVHVVHLNLFLSSSTLSAKSTIIGFLCAKLQCLNMAFLQRFASVRYQLLSCRSSLQALKSQAGKSECPISRKRPSDDQASMDRANHITNLRQLVLANRLLLQLFAVPRLAEHHFSLDGTASGSF